MKRRLITLLLVCPALATAQNYQAYQGMSEADMQRMMQQMQKAQTCMGDLDEAELKKFEQQAMAMEARVREHCASGDTDAAEQEAMAFGREVAASPTMQKIQECSKLMQGAMPGMTTMAMQTDAEADSGSICDE